MRCARSTFGIVVWLVCLTFAPLIADDDVKVGEVRRFEGHTDKVTCVALSPDGQSVLSSSDDRTVRRWDVASGKLLQTFEGHGDYALSVAFRPDGSTALSGGGGLWDPTKRFYFPGTDHALRLWEMESGKVLRRFEGHTAPVWSVALSADGRRAISGSGGYQVNGGQPVFQGGRPVSSGYEVRLWDVESGQPLRVCTGHTNWVRSVAFSPDGSRAVSGSWDGTVRVWDTTSGEELRVLKHAGPVDSIAISPDGKVVLAAGGPLGAGGDTDIHVWDLTNGEEIRRFTGHTKRVWSLTFSPDGLHALSGSSDTTIRLWDVASGRELHRLEGHSDEVRRAVFAADGKHVLSGSHDKTVRLWRLPD